MKFSEARQTYRLVSTAYPRVFIGQLRTGPVNGTVRGLARDHFSVITVDDLADYAPTGPAWRTFQQAVHAADLLPADWHTPLPTV